MTRLLLVAAALVAMLAAAGTAVGATTDKDVSRSCPND